MTAKGELPPWPYEAGSEQLYDAVRRLVMSLDAFVFCPGGDDTSNPQHVKVRVHLGNLAAIGYLRDRVAKALPPTSIVLGKVLYSGSHTGDAIDASHMPTLKRELQTLGSDADNCVQAFVRDMTLLAEVAAEQGTGITF